MALRAVFDGAEMGGAVDHGTGLFEIFDYRKARSGRGYLSFHAPTVSSTRPSLFVSGFPTLTSGGDSSVNGDGGIRAMGRMFVRPHTYPSADLELFGCSFTSSWGCGVAMNSSGQLFCHIEASISYPGGLNSGTPSAAAIPLAAGDYSQWTSLEVDMEVTNGVGATDAITLTCVITHADGTTETISHTRTAITIASSIPSNPAWLRSTGIISNAGNLSGHLDFDDMVMVMGTGADAASVTLPAEDRVMLVLPTGPGSLQQWTGTWEPVDKIQAQSGSFETEYVSAGSAGLVATYAHETVAQIDAGITSIGGVLICPMVYTGGTVAAAIYYNGASYPGTGTNVNWTTSSGAGSNEPFYCTVAPLALAAFDAVEWGVQSVHASANRLKGLPAQILYSGDAQRADLAAAAGYQQAFVSWTGDGATRQEVTGAGFAPHMVLPIALTASTVAGAWKQASLPGNIGMSWDGVANATTQKAIMRFTTDGFVVGPSWNASGVEYTALCVRDDGDGEGGRVFIGGEFSNFGGSKAEVFQAEDGTPFQPDHVMVLRRSNNTGDPIWKSVDMGGTTSVQLDGNVVPGSTGIVSLDSNGFTLGALAGLITTRETVSYIAWRNTSEALAAGVLNSGAIPAGTVDVVVSPGFRPHLVIARPDDNTQAHKRLDIPAIFSGTDCQLWQNGSLGGANSIIQIDSSLNTFTVDGGGTILQAGYGCWWLAFGEVAAVAPPPATVEVVFPPGRLTPLIWVEVYLPE